MEKPKDVKKGDCMMKQRRTKNRYFSWFTLLLVFLLIGANRAVKAEIEEEVKLEGDCYYQKDYWDWGKDNEIMIIGIRKGVKNPYIPDKINGKKVTSIWLKDEFEQGEKNIDTLNIPRYAEYSCAGMLEVKIKNFKVHAKNKYYCIKGGCLYSKDKKTLVFYPNGREEKSFTIPKGTLEIANNAFRYSQVEKVVMPDSVQHIGSDVFLGSKLKSIKLSSKLTEISQRVFSKSELRNIVLPKSLKYISCWAFADCKKLESVIIPKKNHLDSIEEDAFRGCSRLKKFIYPKSVGDSLSDNNIEANAFRDCIRLEKVVISESDLAIGDRCFYNCKKLKEITIKGHASIYNYAFYKCKSLQKVTLKGSISICKGAFQKCGKLRKIQIVSNAKEGYIDDKAFVKKGKKKKLTIIAPKDSYAYNYAKEHKKQGLKVKALK